MLGLCLKDRRDCHLQSCDIWRVPGWATSKRLTHLAGHELCLLPHGPLYEAAKCPRVPLTAFPKASDLSCRDNEGPMLCAVISSWKWLLGRQNTQGRTTQECEFQEVGIDGAAFGIWLSHSMGHRLLRLSLGLGWGPKLFLASSQMMLTLCLEALWSIPYSHFCTSWIGISQTWEKGGKWKNTHKKYLSSLLYVLDTR